MNFHESIIDTFTFNSRKITRTYKFISCVVSVLPGDIFCWLVFLLGGLPACRSRCGMNIKCETIST